MRPKTLRILSGLVVLFVVASACSLFQQAAPVSSSAKSATSFPTLPPASAASPLPTTGATAAPGSQPVQLSGDFKYTNDILTTYNVEDAVQLQDMHGFVIRDQGWIMPVQSQIMGYAKLDKQNKTGTFWLELPIQPAALYEDVDNNGQKNTGLQIFALTYYANLAGGLYGEGDDPNKGWPNYLASVTVDPQNNNEVTGGKLVIWSPDNNEEFPTGFGADGLLFTKDDPVGPAPAGWSVIDLDQKPFAILRDRESKLTLYEPTDIAIKDFSGQSYTQSFDNMFNLISKEYAFNGVQGKAPDWKTLYSQIQPRVKQAEDSHDPYAFFLALHDFVLAFKDGHTSVSGDQYFGQYLRDRASGGYGFTIRQLDDGSVIVTHIVSGAPAEAAGVKVGDKVVKFDNKPIDQAISDTPLAEGPESTDLGRREQQARYLVRSKVGTQAVVTFQRGSDAPNTVTLTSVPETESWTFTQPFASYDPNAVPVEYRVLDTGQGYIKINSYYDDLNLIMRLFKRALDAFQKENIDSVIIDQRVNPGGYPLGLAGYFTSQPIDRGQLEYYNDKTGKFQPNGPRDQVIPFVEQYHFGHMALLISDACASACEIESYGFSQIPGMKVVGETPTAGVEAEVARGQFKMPEGISMQFPTGRFTRPDGSIFLEGKGVQPNVKVPVTAETVLSPGDAVLKAAEEALR